MSNNKLSSINKYTVNSVSKVSTNTSITKRPYDSSSDKGNDHSGSFKHTLKSSESKKSSDDEDKDFSDQLSNELNNRLRLDSRETLRVINRTSNTTPSNKDDTNKKTSSPQVNAKLRDAMKVKVDTSELYKKLQKLNSLK